MESPTIRDFQAHLPQRLYEVMVRPYLEGLRRIEQGMYGVDSNSIYAPALKWKERTLSVLSGCSLLFPFVNHVIWIAMGLFGNRQTLSPSFCPPEVMPPAPPARRPLGHLTGPLAHLHVAPVVDRPEEPPAPPRHVEYQQSAPGHDPITFTLVISTKNDGHSVSKTQLEEIETSHFDQNWGLLSYAKGQCKITKGKTGQLTVKLPQTQQIIHQPLSDHPWIQHNFAGFQPYVLDSNRSELTYYVVNLKDGSLQEMFARFNRTEKEVVEVTITSKGLAGSWYPTRLRFAIRSEKVDLIYMESLEPTATLSLKASVRTRIINTEPPLQLLPTVPGESHFHSQHDQHPE